MSAENGVVHIGADHMYQEVRRVSDGLIRLEVKVDELLNADRDVGNRLDDHESRIRRLEAAKWPPAQIGMLTGVLGVLVALAAFIWKQ